MATMGACLQCGSETTNPKYCSRACAATQNNRTTPKRRPEGECTTCGTPVSTRLRYCEPCRAKADQKAQDALENAIKIRLLDGHVERLALPRASLFERRVISFSAHELRPERASCGDVILAILGVLSADREFMSVHDRARHATFLRDLLDFRPNIRGRTMDLRSTPAISLESAIMQWVESFFRREDEPLHLSYAINTAELVERIALGGVIWGAAGQDSVWLEGLLGNRDERRCIEILHRSSFPQGGNGEERGEAACLGASPSRLSALSDVGQRHPGRSGRRVRRAARSRSPFGGSASRERQHPNGAARPGRTRLRPVAAVRLPMRATHKPGRRAIRAVGTRPAVRRLFTVRQRARISTGACAELTVSALWFSDVIELSVDRKDERAFRRRALPTWTAEKSD
jgi:hypothetical protein